MERIHSRISQRIRRWRYDKFTKSIHRKNDFGKFDKFNLAEKGASGYFSQCGQDKLIAETLFPGVQRGIFVDIGAHDGITFSNTYFLEKMLRWHGLAIEPNPVVYKRLKKNRACKTLNCCVAANSGKYKFRMISGYAEMLSGLVQSYDPTHLTRIGRELEYYGGDIEDIYVRGFSINDLLEDQGLQQVHYLSIDVEGAELEILQALDTNRFDINVIGVENNYKDFRIPKIMKQIGYKFHSIVGDEFYVKQ